MKFMLAERVLEIESGISDIDIASYTGKLEELERKFIKAFGPDASRPARSIASLMVFLHDSEGFRSGPELYLFYQTLDTKTGNCFTLSCLYLSLGERLGLPLRAVMAPYHVIVGIDGTGMCIETTSGSLEMDEHYISSHSIDPRSIENRAYMSRLAPEAIVACALENRACFYVSSGRLEAALGDANAAINVAPTIPSLYNLRGGVYARMFRLKEASEDYDRCIELDPNYRDAFRNRAWASMLRLKPASALRDFYKASRLPSRPE